MEENKTEFTYRVFGKTTAYPHPEHVWAWPDEESAIAFAVSCAEETETKYEVYKVVAIVAPKPIKVDVIVTRFDEKQKETNGDNPTN